MNINCFTKITSASMRLQRCLCGFFLYSDRSHTMFFTQIDISQWLNAVKMSFWGMLCGLHWTLKSLSIMAFDVVAVKNDDNNPSKRELWANQMCSQYIYFPSFLASNRFSISFYRFYIYNVICSFHALWHVYAHLHKAIQSDTKRIYCA